MNLKNLAQLIMMYLPTLVLAGDLDENTFFEITGRTIAVDHSTGTVDVGGRTNTPLYEVIEPEIYTKTALTFAAGGSQTLLDEQSNFARGTISLDKGLLPKTQMFLCTGVVVTWKQEASSSAGAVVYENTTASIQAELQNAVLVVEIGSGPAFRIPVGHTQFGTKPQRFEDMVYAIPSPKLIGDADQIRIKIEYPAAGTGLSGFTADTYLSVELYGARLRKKSNI